MNYVSFADYFLIGLISNVGNLEVRFNSLKWAISSKQFWRTEALLERSPVLCLHWRQRALVKASASTVPISGPFRGRRKPHRMKN